MSKYRKKPVVIEARQLLDDLASLTDITNWITESGGKFSVPFIGDWLVIHTLEGEMRASLGDYIIKGVRGEFYPCKPDIFERTYERVVDA